MKKNMQNKPLKIIFIITIVFIFIVGCTNSKDDKLKSEEFVEMFITDYYEVDETDKDRVTELKTNMLEEQIDTDMIESDTSTIVESEVLKDYYNQMVEIYGEYLEIDLIDKLVANRLIDNVDRYAVIEDKQILVRELTLSLNKEDLTSDENIRFLYDYSIELDISQNDESKTVEKVGKVRVYKTKDNWIIDYIDFQRIPITRMPRESKAKTNIFYN